MEVLSMLNMTFQKCQASFSWVWGKNVPLAANAYPYVVNISKSSLFLIGPQPSEQYGTRAVFGLSANINISCWSAAVTGPPGDTLALSICSAPDAPIGRYSLSLGHSARIEFVLLFNPWCPGA